MKMLPAITPIARQASFDPFGPLGRGNKNAVLPAANKIPTALSPLIGFLNEEIGRKTQLNQRVGRAVFVLQFISGFALGDDVGVSAISLVHFEHKAVLTAGTCFFAAVPWISRDRFFNFGILHNVASAIPRFVNGSINGNPSIMIDSHLVCGRHCSRKIFLSGDLVEYDFSKKQMTYSHTSVKWVSIASIMLEQNS